MSDRVITRTQLFALLTIAVASIVAPALGTAVFLGWVQVDSNIGALVGFVTCVSVFLFAWWLLRIYIKEQETAGGLVLADPLGIGSKIAVNEEDRDD